MKSPSLTIKDVQAFYPFVAEQHNFARQMLLAQIGLPFCSIEWFHDSRAMENRERTS